MPVVLLERIPLPSLRTYTSVSVLLVACVAYYVQQVLTGQMELEISDKNETESVLMSILNSAKNVSLEEDGYMMGTLHVISHTTWCVWVSKSCTFLSELSRTLYQMADVSFCVILIDSDFKFISY